MNPITISFIINPVSGRKNPDKVLQTIKKHIDRSIYQPQFLVTSYAGHAYYLAKQEVTSGTQLIIVVGGDGTVNEVASALMGSKTCMAIIPTGSGNGLARHLGIPVSIKKSVRLLGAGKIVAIDAAKAGDRYFFCTCGTGFDALISKKFDKANRRGFIGYAKLVVATFRSYKPRKYKFIADGNLKTIRAFAVTFANANQYGNNFKVAPQASICDRLFDIAILKPFPPRKAFGIARRMINGSLHKGPYFECIKASKIEFIRNKKNLFHLDGDPVKFNEMIRIRVLKKQVLIMVPRNRFC